jgi:hypothetical protein
LATRGSIAELLADATGDDRRYLPETVRRLIFSQPDRVTTPARKLTVRPILIRGQSAWQFEWQRGNQAVHENLDSPSAYARLCEAGSEFRQVLVRTAAAETQGRRDRGPDWAWSTRPLEGAPTSEPAAHNAERARLIPEGTPVPFLVEVGVMTPEGRVRRDQQHKFRQINRFLEFVRDIVPALPATGTLEVIDFGSGKSSLTFAVHHYLTVVLGRSVNLLGIDRKESVVAECARLGKTLGCAGLSFQAGEIAAYNHPRPVDLAISLHACDTATDDALIAATRWGARAILAVPCCQHELAPQLNIAGAEALLSHGILRERLATLATDALRAEWLENHGYSAQVIEFIDTEHTPKNLLIRATRRERNDGRDLARAKRYREFREFLGVGETWLDRHGGGADAHP